MSSSLHSWDASRLSFIAGETLAADDDSTAGRVSSGTFGGREERTPALPIGTVFNGRYTVSAVLGEGGMGVVYAVQDAIHPERSLALKTIHGGMLKPQRISLFKAEFKTMADLRHPNVAGVFDFEAVHGAADHFFTMERCDGDNLLVVTEGASAEDIVALFVQVCRALAYLHTRGIIHYDVKPSNVIVNREGQVKVLDFGLVGASPAAGILGTPAYMAPELFVADADVDPRVDMYSLGITLYHLFARKVPFAGNSLAHVMRLHAEEALDFSGASVPEWLRPIILRLCAKEPGARYPHAHAVIDDVNRRGGLSFAITTEETRQSYVLSSAFVGRKADLDAVLEHIWNRTDPVRKEAPPLLAIGGPAGIGKSRLMREAKQQIQLFGLACLDADCHETGLGELGALGAVLRQAIRLAQSTGRLELLDELGHGLTRLLPDVVITTPVRHSPPVLGSFPIERRGLLDRAAELLVRLAESMPYVIYLNDMHWADSDTVELLAMLVRNLRERARWGQRPRLALIISYRNDELRERPLAAYLSGLQADSLTSLELLPLEPDDVHRLVASMLGTDEVPKAVVETLTREAAGLPLFVREVMGMLVESGEVYLERGRWVLNDAVGPLKLSAGMAGAFLRRMASVEPSERRLLEILAVADQPIRIELLAEVSGQALAEVVARVRTLAQRHYVARPSGGDERLALAHPRMRETLYPALAARDRQALHQRLGETFERAGGDEPADIYRVATHFRHADLDDPAVRQKALRYCKSGAQRAHAANAIDTAVTLYRWGLELMSDERRRGTEGRALRFGLAELLLQSSHLEQAIVDARQLADDCDDPFEKARALRIAADACTHLADVPQAMRLLWSGMRALGSPGGSGLAEARHLLTAVARTIRRAAPERHIRPAVAEAMLRLLIPISRLQALYGRPGALLALRCVDLARLLPDTPLAASAHTTLAEMYLMGFSQLRKAEEHATQAESIARRAGAPFELLEAIACKGWAMYYDGRFEEASHVLDEARQLCRKHGFTFNASHTYLPVFGVLWAIGDMREAFQAMREGLQSCERTKSECNKPLLGMGAIVRLQLGQEDQAWSYLAHGDALPDQATTHLAYGTRARMAMAKADAYRLTGDVGASVHWALDYERWAAKAKVPVMYEGEVGFTVARCLLAQRRRGGLDADNERILRRSLKRAVKLGGKLPGLSVHGLTAEALLALLNGKRLRADRCLMAAVARAEAQKAPMLLADACFDVGAEQLASGDAARGRELLERARAAYERCEAHMSAQQARLEMESRPLT